MLPIHSSYLLGKIGEACQRPRAERLVLFALSPMFGRCRHSRMSATASVLLGEVWHDCIVELDASRPQLLDLRDVLHDVVTKNLDYYSAHLNRVIWHDSSVAMFDLRSMRHNVLPLSHHSSDLAQLAGVASRTRIASCQSAGSTQTARMQRHSQDSLCPSLWDGATVLASRWPS